jgi:adenylate cyclase
MIVRNGRPCRLLVAALLAAMIALRLWDPLALQALRFAVLGRIDAWLPPAPIRPTWAIAAEIAAAAAAAALIGWLAPRLRPPQAAAIPGALAVAAILGGVALGALGSGLLLDPTWPLLAIIVLAGGAAVFLYYGDERKRQKVRVAFGHSLPSAVNDALAVTPELVSFEGARRELTIVSIHIRDAGAILAPMPPSEAAAFLRQVQDEVASIVHDHGGMLDRRTGEETLALFNAPVEDPAHAGQAARAAVKIGTALDPLNAARRAAAEGAGRKYLKVHLDIGIDTGPCTVGNLISNHHPAWTAAGPGIAAAIGIGRLCREYGVGIVVGEGAIAGMTDPRVLELDLVRIGAGSKPVRVFTLLDAYVDDREIAARLAAAHVRMIAAYRNREWAEAETALRECRSFRIEALATLYSLYRTRIVTAREIAPPAGWEGAKLGTIEEIDAVTEVTPAAAAPRHSARGRDEGA